MMFNRWNFWQVTEEEAKKIEKESKKEEQLPSAAEAQKSDSTAVPTPTAAGGADAETKEETPASANETKKVSRL